MFTAGDIGAGILFRPGATSRTNEHGCGGRTRRAVPGGKEIARASPDGRPFPPPCRSPHCSLHWLPSPPSHTDEVGRCRPNLDREARGVGACVAELAGPDSISLAPSPIVQQARTKSGFADFAHHGWLPA